MSPLSARSSAGRAAFLAMRAAPSRAVVALDFDGTLAPIVSDPEAARAHPGVAPALRRLAPHVGAVAVVTGRPAATAVAYGGFADVPGLVVLGQYGRERWEAGEVRAPAPPPGVARARDELPALLARLDLPDGVRVEDKGSALAVHTRRSADPAGALEALREPLRELAERTGLALEPGRLVLELRPPGTDKGDAVRNFAAERDASAVLYAGDDLGDLAAFRAVEELRARGIPGVTVCSGSAEVDALARRADVVVDGPAGVVALLEDLASDLAAAQT